MRFLTGRMRSVRDLALLLSATVVAGCGGTLPGIGSSKHDGGAACGGTPTGCGCTPKTCGDLGYGCGLASDGCGKQINCGACPAGRVCIGNVCTAGASMNCTATPSDVSDNARGSAVDADTLVWVTGDASQTVMAITKPDGAPRALTTGVDNWPVPFGDSVYWVTDSGSVMKIAKSGGSPTQVAPAPASYASHPFGTNGNDNSEVVDATGVYWTDATGVWRAPLQGGSPTEVVGGFMQTTAIALDNSNVYFSDRTTKKIYRVPKAGGQATPITPAENDVFGAVIAGGDVYYATDTGVRFVAVTGAASSNLLASAAYPQWIATDGTTIYFSANGPGDVYALAASGGTPTKLASLSGPMWGAPVAVDQGCVYWNTNDLVLHMVAK